MRCLSDDQIMDESNMRAPEEYLNSLIVSGIPKHDLRLKKGMPILLMRNINPKQQLCNGTRLLVEEV